MTPMVRHGKRKTTGRKAKRKRLRTEPGTAGQASYLADVQAGRERRAGLREGDRRQQAQSEQPEAEARRTATEEAPTPAGVVDANAKTAGATPPLPDAEPEAPFAGSSSDPGEPSAKRRRVDGAGGGEEVTISGPGGRDLALQGTGKTF